MTGSSGSTNTTSTVKSGPPDYLKPYVTGAADAAQHLYQAGGPQVFPGSTVANLSPETQQGWAATAARAANGSPLNAAAGNYINQTLGPNFNNAGNPQLDAVYGNVASHVVPTVNSQFSLGGRYGSNQHVTGMTEGLTNAYAPFALQQFQGNQQLQHAAAQMAPGQAGQDYVDTAALTGVGTARDQYGQALVTDAANRFAAQQQRPYANLDRYTASLYGSPWGSQQSQQPVYQPGIGQQIAGGLLGAAGAVGSFLPR